ncbi:hypothetical protein K461DRAFT_272810 [Myriangium duriaei CBS 260.36]|uniref:RING-type domain-containing protein n=1 Tax=Myriangium duriaei CBS 260.36 TaxID=1168546 RepID=A0A9P4J7D7_9PEZI|nr:hypothetical protein K461DRAFT_272810 [Myriangium duriaei CBS 260.36]
MAETCIVCLGDLRSSHSDDVNQPSSPASDASEPVRIPRLTRSTANTASEADDERIAHLLPCKHDLHNGCLKPWVERANSCPICRAIFNEVELKDFVDGPTIDSYPVQDKRQEADVDPTLVIDDSLFEDDEPCLICGTINDAYEVMFCDGCDRTVHVFCAGSQEAPDVWYCHDCIQVLNTDADLPNAGGLPHTARPRARRSREPRQPRRRQPRRPNSDWARVWQNVWDNLNLDLDFPFDDEPAETRRTPAQRREFSAWQRRLRVATRQGAANRFRETAPALLDRAPPEPESQEELRAWNAFDKARELQETNVPNNRRKRTAETASPASPRENVEPERRQKRPRTRRNLPVQGSSAQAESSSRAVSRPEGPSFLTSLLNEVEKQPQSDHPSPSSPAADDLSPVPMSSREGSPILSGHGTPRAASVTPPPLMLPRSSITPLTSIVRPLPSPPAGAFSPFSPADIDGSDTDGPRRSRARNASGNGPPHRDQSPQSPSRNLSFSTKSEIQRMVKNALRPRYRDNEVTKDQYTDINRDVSRMLYDHVEDANDLADYDSRNRLQKLATDEVQKAIDALQS